MAPVPRLAAIALAACCGGLLGACHSPSEDFDRFLEATGDMRSATSAVYSSTPADIGGNWFVNVSLAGFQIGLRMKFVPAQATPPSTMKVEIWTSSQTIDVDTPVVSTTSDIDATGRFTLKAQPLLLPVGSIKNFNLAINADVIFDCYTQSMDEWCGGASGKIIEPDVGLTLDGSTLGAARDPNGTKTVMDVSPRCPASATTQ